MKTRHHNEQGVALVVTVIVVAMLAVVGVALMQSVSQDRSSSRSVANYTRAQLAADAGVADAMSRMAKAMTNFNYVSGGEVSGGGRYRTYVRPRMEANGSWQFNGASEYLDSGTGGETTNILVAGSNAASGVTVQASYTNFATSAQTTNRYAFWVDEAGAKQNLSWWGGGGTRDLVTNVSDIPLVLPAADGKSVSPMPPNAVTGLQSNRVYSTVSTNLFGLGNVNTRTVSNALLTPATFNLLSTDLKGVASRYFFALANPSTAVTPLGGKKLDLQRLASYVNTLSLDQASGNARSKLVDDLLTDTPVGQANWSGGSLSWLAKSGAYTTDEQKQIVADLLDYLDSDMIPTTDNADNPTYFGVEMKADSSGLVMGHPVINFVSSGMIFNRNTNGLVNSSRIVCSLGVVYPWSSASVSTANYVPEINFTVEGDVENGVPGMASGSAAAPAYFRSGDLSEEMTIHPVSTFSARKGNNWPQDAGLAGTASYSSPFYGNSTGNWPDRGPTNMTFRNLKYVFKKLRLRYTAPDGSIGYVQILPQNLTITNVPEDVVAGGGSGSKMIKFTEDAYKDTLNLYLAGDPRANFKTSAWTNLSSKTPFGTNLPPPNAGIAAVALTNGVSTNWDGAQSLAMDFNWFTSAKITNHFNRSTNTNAGIQSIGELGYLWTGKPWQTLNMTNTNAGLKADWNLLDYVSGGYQVDGTNFTTMPFVLPNSANTKITASNSLVQDGGFNVLTRKQATISAFFTNAPGLATNAASDFVTKAPPDFASVGGALAVLADLSAVSSTKFASEALVRAAANAAVVQSRIFTVYSKGEYINGPSRSSVTLEADVFVDVNPQTGAPQLRVISKKYL